MNYKEFLKRLWLITKKRINESKYTKLFTLLVILTTVVGIILEGIVVNSNLKVYQELIDDQSIPNVQSTSDKSSSDPGFMVALGLRRLKNENVFFILFSLFQLVLGLDAIVRESVIQLVSHTLNQILMVIFACIQVGSTIRKHLDVQNNIPPPEDPVVSWNFIFALHNEIALVSIMSLFACIFIFFSWKLYKQFGWNIYKKIGADIEQQERFRLTQILFLNLKLDAFFHFVLCVFYSVVMTQEQYYAFFGRKLVGYVIHIILTILLIPGLFLARYGVIHENKQVMLFFLVTQAIMGLDFILIMVDSAGSWVFWMLAVSLAIVLCISTIFLTIFVSRNFGKGLKPYMKRLFTDEIGEKQNTDLPVGQQGLLKKDDWLIDEEEDYPMNPQHP